MAGKRTEQKTPRKQIEMRKVSSGGKLKPFEMEFAAANDLRKVVSFFSLQTYAEYFKS